jgi:hypothetical protein
MSSADSRRVGAGDGRRPLPLLQRINTAGLKMFFALLLWRGLSSLDMAMALSPSLSSSSLSSSSSLLLVVPQVFLLGALLSANIFGLLLSFTRPLNFKNQLKFLLGLNILKEGGELLANALRVLLPGAGRAREEYVMAGLVNCWWLTLCYTYTRSRWTLGGEEHDERGAAMMDGTASGAHSASRQLPETGTMIDKS